MFGKRFTRALVVTTVAALTMAAAAFADEGYVDTEPLVTTSISSSLNLGTVAPGATLTPAVGFVLKCEGKEHVDAGQTVNFTFTTSGGTLPPTGGAITAQNGSIGPIPASWADDTSGGGSTNCTSADEDLRSASNATVTITAPSTPGDYGASARWLISLSPTGADDSPAINQHVTANFTLTVQSAPTNAAPSNVSAAFTTSEVGCRVSTGLQVSFTDADSTSWSVEFDWNNDGTFEETDSSFASGDIAPHTYNAAGTYTAAVRITDNQGATSAVATATIDVQQTYTVTFLQPLNGSSTGNLVANTFKNGRVLPVKATIFDDCTLTAIDGSSSVIPTIKLALSALAGSTGTDAVEEFADAGQSSANTNQMRWSDDGFWIYNLDSKALGMKSGSNYRLNIFMGSTQATASQWVILSPQK